MSGVESPERHQPRPGAACAPSQFGRAVRRFNVPNVLTTLRILGIPVFLWLIIAAGGLGDPDLHRGQRWAAFAVFFVLMVTDQLDGFLARRYEVITDFGKLADPLADKALMITALISLNIVGDLWWWVTAVIVVRELGITVWRFVLARGGRVVPASRGGKIKTVLQAFAVGVLLAPLTPWTTWVGYPLMALAVVVTVVTGVQYLVDARKEAP